ncbi:MAG: hypothetical protein ACO3JL_18000, partial [Myxococcota bacterium]
MQRHACDPIADQARRSKGAVAKDERVCADFSRAQVAAALRAVVLEPILRIIGAVLDGDESTVIAPHRDQHVAVAALREHFRPRTAVLGGAEHELGVPGQHREVAKGRPGQPAVHPELPVPQSFRESTVMQGCLDPSASYPQLA